MSSSIKVDHNNNFCRVFLIPEIMSEAHCFNKSHSVTFEMVDWFNPISFDDIRNDTLDTWEVYEKRIKEFLKEKKYMTPGRSYLLLTDFNESLVFRKEG